MEQGLSRAVSEEDRDALAKWLADRRIVRPESGARLVWTEGLVSDLRLARMCGSTRSVDSLWRAPVSLTSPLEP